MVFAYYGNVQIDSAAVAQLSDMELRAALVALEAGTGFPQRGATPEDVKAAGNLLRGEAVKRGFIPYGARASASSASTEAQPVNWALVAGGAALLYFVMK
jgi:hypothetical protein